MVTQNDNPARRVEYSPEPIPIYSLRMKGKVPYDPKRLITQAEYVLAKVWWDGLSDSSRVELGLCNEFQLQNALQDCKTWLAGSSAMKVEGAIAELRLLLERADNAMTSLSEEYSESKLRKDIKKHLHGRGSPAHPPPSESKKP